MDTPKDPPPAAPAEQHDPRPPPDRAEKEIEEEMDDYIESVRRISPKPEKSS
jgi:hypothetical protein